MNGASSRMMPAADSSETRRGLFSQKTKPSASAPASTAAVPSLRLVMPQILTLTAIFTIELHGLSGWTILREEPSFNNQHPTSRELPNPKRPSTQLSDLRYWSLVLGASLDLGSWMLELFPLCLPPHTFDKSHNKLTFTWQ